MATLLGPDFISLQVRDLAVSRRFYTEVVGLEVSAFTAPDFVLFESTTIPFGSALRPADQAEPDQPAAGVALWLDCDNVDELHAQLVAAGATILRSPAETPFGRAVVFADPDGYRITANQNPWTAFRGTVKLTKNRPALDGKVGNKPDFPGQNWSIITLIRGN